MYTIYLQDETEESKTNFVITDDLLLSRDPPFSMVSQNFDLVKFNESVIKKINEWPNFDPEAKHLKSFQESRLTEPERPNPNKDAAPNDDEVKQEPNDEEGGNEKASDDEDVIICFENTGAKLSDAQKSRDRQRKSIAVFELSTEAESKDWLPYLDQSRCSTADLNASRNEYWTSKGERSLFNRTTSNGQNELYDKLSSKTKLANRRPHQ